MLDNKMDKSRSMYRYTDEEVAQVCHAANREMQSILGEEIMSPPWLSDSLDMHKIAINGVRKVRAGASYAEIHDEWVRFKLELGWTYGLQKDPIVKTHPCLVLWNELSQEQRDKDIVFYHIVVALTASLD